MHNRVGWARTYMKKAGLLDTTRRGCFRISPVGLQVLQKRPQRTDIGFLEHFVPTVRNRRKHRGFRAPSIASWSACRRLRRTAIPDEDGSPVAPNWTTPFLGEDSNQEPNSFLSYRLIARALLSLLYSALMPKPGQYLGLACTSLGLNRIRTGNSYTRHQFLRIGMSPTHPPASDRLVALFRSVRC